MTGYVYILKFGNIYKIGMSVDVEKRMQDISGAYRSTIPNMPYPIELVCDIKTNAMSKLEKRLHRKYRERRTNGEWFELSDSDVEEIKALPGANITGEPSPPVKPTSKDADLKVDVPSYERHRILINNVLYKKKETVVIYTSEGVDLTAKSLKELGKVLTKEEMHDLLVDEVIPKIKKYSDEYLRTLEFGLNDNNGIDADYRKIEGHYYSKSKKVVS